MKKLLGIVFLSFFFINFALAELVNSEVREKYKIDNKILAITNNGFLDEIWICNTSLTNCKMSARVFSFVALAEECEAIKEKNIYFAQTKDYYFMGGWNEQSPLKIFDLKSNLLGTSPDIEYAKKFCKFKLPSH
tara:strand:+ start:128 stop:529 length:402 start_codon:yes stop_codon:yes gene_type:complete